VNLRDILYEVEEGVARIILNKPDKLNALSWGSWADIETAIETVNVDDAVRCVLITGAGRGFSAGTDLTVDGSDERPRPYKGRRGTLRTPHLCTATVYDCRKPTIAAVNGVSVGAGFSLALACDIRIASETARFSAIFTKRGLSADTGATWFLPRTIGMERALEMLYTGRLVDAAEAEKIGLVSEVVAPDKLMERANALAYEIAHGPTLAIEINKRLAREGMERTLMEHIEAEQFLQLITHQSEDAKEGRLSFLEKREPVFKGR
jgi:2-(1,2-epoxy-1,2-dihydrophenyl)acetyl-CoA isomerase